MKFWVLAINSQATDYVGLSFSLKIVLQLEFLWAKSCANELIIRPTNISQFFDHKSDDASKGVMLEPAFRLCAPKMHLDTPWEDHLCRRSRIHIILLINQLQFKIRSFPLILISLSSKLFAIFNLRALFLVSKPAVLKSLQCLANAPRKKAT